MRVSKLTPILAVVALAGVVFASFSFAKQRESAQGGGAPPIPADMETCRDGIENVQHLMARNDALLEQHSLGVNLNLFVIDCTPTERGNAVFVMQLSNDLSQFVQQPDIVLQLPDGTTARPVVRSINPQTVAFNDANGELWTRVRYDRRFTIETTLTQPGRHAYRFEPLPNERGRFNFRYKGDDDGTRSPPT